MLVNTVAKTTETCPALAYVATFFTDHTTDQSPSKHIINKCPGQLSLDPILWGKKESEDNLCKLTFTYTFDISPVVLRDFSLARLHIVGEK